MLKEQNKSPTSPWWSIKDVQKAEGRHLISLMLLQLRAVIDGFSLDNMVSVVVRSGIC